MAVACPWSVPIAPELTLPLTVGSIPTPTSTTQREPLGWLCACAGGAAASPAQSASALSA